MPYNSVKMIPLFLVASQVAEHLLSLSEANFRIALELPA